MHGGRCLGELEHPRDDGLELIELLPDHPHIGAAGIVGREIQTQITIKELDHREWVADLVGNLGRQQSQRGKLLVLAQHILALENTGVESRVLQRHGGQAGKGGEQPFLVVIKPVGMVGKHRQNAHRLVFPKHRHRQQGTQRRMPWQIDHVDVLGGLHIQKLKMTPGGERRAHQTGIEGQIALGQRRIARAVQRNGAQTTPGRHVFKEQGCPGPEQAAGVAGDGVVQLLAFQFGDQGQTGIHQILQLRRLASQMLQLPEPQQDRGALLGQRDQIGQITGGEPVDRVAIQIDHAEDLAVFRHQRRSDLSAHLGPHRNVTRIRPHIGHQLWTAMKSHPSGDALTGTKRDVINTGRHATMHFNLQATRIRI